VADWAEEFDAQQARRLGSLSRSEALERIAKYPPEWRVDGVLSTDDYGVLAGPKGVGKTFALEDLAVSVALGRPWFGRFSTQAARVLLLTSEDSEARLWRRADAIARSLGAGPEELDDRLFIHPWAFSAVTDLARLRYELRAIQPGLAVLDPAYRYLSGAAAQLFDMGAVLTPLQEVCATEGAPLIVGHHYNRKNGARREERISGAGLLEWARLVITAEAPVRRAEDPDVVVTFEVTGNSIDPLVFKVRRRVEALDDSPNPELRYAAEVISEGAEARAREFATAADRVYAVLGQGESNRMTVREIGDAVAHDDTGRGGLKYDTIDKALRRDLEGRVDSVKAGRDTFWWAVE
jgi:AAA domain